MLTDLAAEVLPPDLDRGPRRPHERSPHRGVERQVVIAGAREPVTRVLPAAPVDERPRPTSEPSTLEPVGAAAAVEDAGRIDGHRLDSRGTVRGGIRVER